MIRLSLTVAGAFLATSTSQAATLSCTEPAWRMVYRHDADGKPITGSKQSLFDAIRRGDPIRLAWGGAFKTKDGKTLSVEHSADPVFVAIASGTDVVAQIPEHLAQSSYSDAETARFNVPAGMWRGMFSTTGRFDAAFVDRGTGKELRRLPQRAAVAWFAFAPEPTCDSRQPLDLAIEGGVRLDNIPTP